MVRYYIFCNRCKSKMISGYIWSDTVYFAIDAKAKLYLVIYGQILYILQSMQKQNDIWLYMVRYCNQSWSLKVSEYIKLHMVRYYIFCKRSKSKQQTDIKLYMVRYYYILQTKQNQTDIKLYMARYYIFCKRSKIKLISNYIWSDTIYSANEAKSNWYQTVYSQILYILQTKQNQTDIKLYIVRYYIFCKRSKIKLISNCIYSDTIYSANEAKSNWYQTVYSQILYILQTKQNQTDIKLYIVRYYIFCKRSKIKLISNYIWSDTIYSANEAKSNW